MNLSLQSDKLNNAPLSHIASPKLNICAVLSSLKRHAEARVVAKEAVSHVMATVNDLEDPIKTNQYINIDKTSLYNTLTIAQFNLGVENEHLNDLNEALNAYELA